MEILFFAYFILVLLPYVNENLKNPKGCAMTLVESTRFLFFPVAFFLGFTCPAVAYVSYRFIFIHDSCILLMCQ